jgi:N-acetylneuraminate synthase/N,N'-diacetyllegionaminate synthase
MLTFITAEMFLKKFSHLPLIIAEAGVNHNGSPALAEKLVDAAAEAGADLVKFQTFKAFECAGCYAKTAEYQKNSSAKDQLSLLAQLELPFSFFAELKKRAENLGLGFISTPDGQLSLNLLCELQVMAIKVASGELTNFPYLAQIGSKSRPVILSTGMGTLGETQKAIDTLANSGAGEIILLHCTTEYPAIPQDINLQAIKTLQQAFGLPVGFSDHSIGNEAAVAATALGCQVIEKHLTLDKSMPGPDHAASMNPQELPILSKP